ncbi:MAG TPA: serine/threonine-protein kinase [Gemmatimonadaceae bacterium]|nr:serine/threonine-protein kinase [Gemmatimonadaceae bacterium]
MNDQERATARMARFREALGERYRVERELASGGTATVYLATDLKYQRPVAVKVFRPEVAEVMGHERFIREIAFVATLNHPHIVPLLDSGEAGELLYYVMPAVEGESLRDRMTRERQLPIDDVLRIAHDVAVALDYAHARHIVHRDVKPENILLSMGTAVVADFGIAKMLNAAKGNSLTRAGIALGTVAYMSPEQGSAGPVDGRTDTYALGCVVFEMLAGRPPFVGKSTRAVVAAHFTQPMPSLRAFRDDVTPAMEVAIARALAKAPEERFATAAAFVDALAEAHRGPSGERLLMRGAEGEARALLGSGGPPEAAPDGVAAGPATGPADGATTEGPLGAWGRWIVIAAVTIVGALGLFLVMRPR